MKLSQIFRELFFGEKKEKFPDEKKERRLYKQVDEALMKNDLQTSVAAGQAWYDYEMKLAQKVSLVRWRHSMGTTASISLSEHLENLRVRLQVEFYSGSFDRKQEETFKSFKAAMQNYATERKKCKELERSQKTSTRNTPCGPTV